MTRRSVLTAALVLIAGVLAPAILAAADPAGVINNLGNRALEVLGKNVPPAQRVARFQELFRQDFDVPGIARFVLGRYWKSATSEQQEEFVKLFEDYIARVYSSQLAAYSGETLKVTGSRVGLRRSSCCERNHPSDWCPTGQGRVAAGRSTWYL